MSEMKAPPPTRGSTPNWIEIAKETGLAITHKAGIKEVDAGRDRALCLNDVGLKALRRALERAYQQGVDRARDERRDGRDDASRLGAEPASPVAESEAPGTIDKLKRENAELRSALRPFAEAIFETRGLSQFTATQPLLSDWLRARTLLSQSSEGGETK